ncbi:hypothetical protein PM082_019787 [Marasmius tenuissimus]|nr:hypothetical protein PM082_019787 [Marasmius tenuissimus]
MLKAARHEKLFHTIIHKKTNDVAIGPLEYCGNGRRIKGPRGKTVLSVCTGNPTLPEYLLVHDAKREYHKKNKKYFTPGMVKRAMSKALIKRRAIVIQQRLDAHTSYLSEISSSSDVSSADVEVVAAKPSHKLRKHKPVTEPVTYISTDSEDGLGGGSNFHSPDHVHNSPTYNNTDTEQEDIEVSAMFHSMASVSERASLPLVAMNNSTIIYDPYKGYIPDVRF